MTQEIKNKNNKAVVTVWSSCTKGCSKGQALSQWRELLSPSEHQRIARYATDLAAVNHIVGRVLLRKLLSKLSADIKPQSWQIASTREGKPYVLAPVKGRHLRFSISHCDGLVTVAANTRAECGVDVEKVRSISHYQELTERVLTAEERITIGMMSQEEAAYHFLELWTLKEAYGKARGIGLCYPLSQTGFYIKKPPQTFKQFIKIRGQTSKKWFFHTWAPSPETVASLAVYLKSPIEVEVMKKNINLIDL